MTILFFACVFLIIWAYVGYPYTMYLLAKYHPQNHEYDLNYAPPTISVIIAVANGADKIADKLYNVLNSYYTLDLIEVIVVMDGYCAKTDQNIKNFLAEFPQFNSNVKVFDIKKGGKEAAQLIGVKQANNEICVFTDVDTRFKGDAYYHLVKHFYDPCIGAVDGMSKVIYDSHSNEGLYLKYENKIREWESTTCGLVTLGGCLFAARANILKADIDGYKGFVPDLQSDFRTALAVKTIGVKSVENSDFQIALGTKECGYKSILDTDAIAYFYDGAESKEFVRKHRTVVRGINNFIHNLHLLNPFKYGLFSYALFSHKLLKWLVPFFMLGALISSAYLTAYNPTSWYDGPLNEWYVIYIAQILFYWIACLNLKNKYAKIINFFVISNLAILKAWISYAFGKRYVTWEPTKR